MSPIPEIKRALAPLLLFSMLSNLAILISPLFMMQVLDRVVPSGNIATLGLLLAVALAALLAQGGAEALRDLSLRRLGTWVEGVGSRQVVDALAVTAAPEGKGATNAQALIQAVGGLTQAVRGPVALAGLTVPWLPLFLVALGMIHPGFVFLLLGLLVALVLQDRILHIATSGPQAALSQGQAQEQQLFQDAPLHGSRAGVVMLTHHMFDHAMRQQGQRHLLRDRLDLPQAWLGSAATALRSAGQILALGLGAYLVTQNQLSAGGMIAASLILSRSYASFEMVMKQGSALRQALADLRLLSALSAQPAASRLDLPTFEGGLRAENLTCPRGGGAPPFLDRVSLALAGGECLVIVGGAGSGKTSLLNALSAVRPAPIGSVFYDDSAQRSLGPEAAYRHIGTLPQRADLLPGSLADNIACFDPARDDRAVIAAAEAAGVHGLIAALPSGYDSDLSTDPHLLSAGQVQRVALARALYTRPRYLFLDEPNALLDGDGERALLQTLLRLKAAGTTIVMVLHRSGLMGMADKVLRLDQGRVVDFGPRAEVLARLSGNQRRLRLPPLATSLHDLRDWVAAQFTRASDEPFSQKAQIVAQELFHLALEAAVPPKGKPATSPPPELEFSLKFLNEFECELRMLGDAALDLEEKMVRVRKQLAAGHMLDATHPRDERALAALEQMGTALRQQRHEAGTSFQASIIASDAPAELARSLTGAGQTGGTIQ